MVQGIKAEPLLAQAVQAAQPVGEGRYDFETNRMAVQAALEALKERRAYRFVKRSFDLVASLMALVVLSPLFVIIALIIWFDDPHGSPLFIQTRVGQNEQVFRFYKFRSMYVNAEERVKELLAHNTFSGPVFKMDNDPRITRIGALLRKSSIDELPQLLNVLKGDMSLVGPRPPVVWEASEYTPFQKLRLLAKPGLTCYWQIAPNKYKMDFNAYVLLDIQYMKQQSCLTDLGLIWKTVGVMLKNENE